MVLKERHTRGIVPRILPTIVEIFQEMCCSLKHSCTVARNNYHIMKVDKVQDPRDAGVTNF